ncbi:DUF2946 domain-containing protein [Salinicola sp. CR57]|uniref:DUF2946 domain-containing protein n=1 Tax=Salinicola sp. CR57 TaxID=1949086 RepID=UPI000DA26161|nr:DUF2946 domain-containing protein [Salinicola sp. CR57]
MTHFWHRCYRPLTALALFAMLMAFTGPLISQMQRLMEMPAHGGMMMATSHHAAAVDDHRMPSSARSMSADDHWHMAACGYCELFLHAPGIAPPRVTPPVTPPPSAEHPLEVIAPPSPTPVYPRYASRAPPLA